MAKDAESSEEEDVEVLSERVLYIKKDLKSFDQVTEVKYHVQSLKDPMVLACDRKTKVEKCEPVGAYAPEVSMICKKCKKFRADLF